MSPGYYFVEEVLYRAENGPLAFTYGTKSLSMNIILEEALPLITFRHFMADFSLPKKYLWIAPNSFTSKLTTSLF